MTLEAWVRSSSVSGYRTVIMKDHVEGSAYGLYSSGDGPPSAWLRQQGADNHTIASGSSPIGLNTWTHLAATYDGSTAKLYVNGQLAGQTSESGSLDSAGLPMHLGSNTFWQEYFSGLIDEVRVYNRALTAPEIQADMATPISTPPPGGLSASALAPRRPATGRIASATASNPYTPDPIHQASDCWSYQAAKREYGFVKNRFAWCKFGHGYASAGPRGRYTDQIKFRYTVIGYTFQGSRDIRLRLVIDDFKVIRGTQFNSGILNPTLGFGLSVSSKCQRRSVADPDPAVGVANPLSTWRVSSNNEIEFWLTAPQSQSGVSGPDWVSNCEIQPWYDAQNTNPLYTDITPGKYSLTLPWVKYGIRCDTARKMSPFNGCVFSRVLPFLRFSLAQAEVRPEQWLVESWEHFNDAIYHPHLTYPIFDGKTIPGGDSDRPLHREIDDQKITDNRKVSTRTCKWGWRNRQAEIVGKSCDEFPFASTKEGALSGTHYSVDYISHPDNQGFGFYVLGPFYQKERIIENDNFYVQVVED